MRKILTLCVCVVSISLFSSPSFADGNGTSNSTGSWSNSVTVGEAITLSANVQGVYTTPGDGTTYSAATYNKLGTNVYGVASDSQKIKYKKCTSTPCGSNPGVDAPSKGNSTDFSDWNNLGE